LALQEMAYECVPSIRVERRRCYFYRAINKEGNLIDVYLSETRDEKAAEAFFNHAKYPTSFQCKSPRIKNLLYILPLKLYLAKKPNTV